MAALIPPAHPRPRANAWAPQMAVSRSTSPFTFHQQEYAHAGQRWRNTLDFPPLSYAQAREWLAFFLRLNGNAGSLVIPPYGFEARLGAGGGVPVVDGAGQGGQVLNVRGLVAGRAGVWLPGDFIGLGSGDARSFYCVLTAVDADAQGKAAVSIWPRLRVSPGDGDPVNDDDPVGVFALAGGVPQLDVDVISAGFALDVVERIPVAGA